MYRMNSRTAWPRRALGRGWKALALRRFRDAEDGNLIVFAFCLFVAMVMIGGLAVDVMRYESVRTNLQNTLDRSTLAAASLTQDLDAEDVVYDYFEKAGLLDYLTGVEVDEGINYREVTADATAATKPFFLHLLGIDSFDAIGHSVAEQRITNVEIMLVLDVSGSMGSNNRLTNLKSAAVEFVDTVLASDGEDRISIGLVPFNGQVNLGSTLRARYSTTDNHGVANVNCVDLPASVYNSIAMPPSTSLPMTPYADTYSSTNQSTTHTSPTSTDYATVNSANVWCPPSTVNIVRLPSNNMATLKSQINNLTAIGATSINAGMRWGTALMDPGSRSMFTALIGANQMESTWAGRPYDYTDDESMKVIVLMTDGEHFKEERVNAGYRTGLSPIYRSSGDGNYSVRFTSGRPTAAGTKEYWVPHLCTSTNCKNGSNTGEAWRATAWTNNSTAAVQQTWVQVWNNLRASYVAWNFYARALGSSSTTRTNTYNTWIANFRTQTDTDDMDDQLEAICDLAKANSVTVYGIAFEAPSGGQAAISNCASSSAHYYNATGLQIKSAFRSIASNISQLRLTQ